jgi:putative aldouronate transport system permease protein
MAKRNSVGRNIFILLNYTFLLFTTFLCLFPLIHVLAISFSSSWAATAGEVKLWPVAFTWKSYEYVMNKPEFLASLVVSLKRVALGVTINMFLTILCAYPLSKEKKDLRLRGVYSWFFIITILFSGGLIPFYMTVKTLGLINSIWALVLPGAIPVFNVLLLMNFFRQLPKEIEESVFLDGAGHWTNLWRIQVPLSMPAIATLILFTTVGHWNSWFDGLILMNHPKNYPLQSYLQTIVTTIEQRLTNMTAEDVKILSEINDRTTKSAQIFLAALPILSVYPFLQRYFMSGIVLGSVKG